MKINVDAITTEGTIEVVADIYRGFAIKEFLHAFTTFEALNNDWDCYPGGTISGRWVIRTQRLFRIVRIKNSTEMSWGRTHDAQEARELIDRQIDGRLTQVPF